MYNSEGRLSGSHAGQLFSSGSPRDMPLFVVYRVFYIYEFLLLSMYSTSHIWESHLKQQVHLVDDMQRSVADISKDRRDRSKCRQHVESPAMVVMEMTASMVAVVMTTSMAAKVTTHHWWCWDDSLYGDAGDDNIQGGSGDDYVHGSQGDEYIAGGTGGNFFCGGGGDDSIHGGMVMSAAMAAKVTTACWWCL